MQIITFRASTMQEALQQVRDTLGPDAAVLHTKEVSGLGGWLRGRRQVEVTASAEVHVPSRFADFEGWQDAGTPLDGTHQPAPAVDGIDHRDRFRQTLYAGPDRDDESAVESYSLVEDLSQPDFPETSWAPPKALIRLFSDLIDADLGEETARWLVDRVRHEANLDELLDPQRLLRHVSRIIESEIHVGGPISVRSGEGKVVALVGPTGVGKTTTIAKLAAIYRLRHRQRVGLITVDTYRIAAVDQLRTYADIIDLPMEVVSTPREMRLAAERLSGLDLILMDTAGRSPQDDVQIQELKAMLAEAHADEVHLVLSSVANTACLQRTIDQFAAAGATAILLTKLDEVTGLGHLLPLLRRCPLPISFVTDGQDVPDDIEAADATRLARLMLVPLLAPTDGNV